MFEVRIELDSVNEHGDRLTTFVCTYERFMHSELMTHRLFSRNAASSRAIPVAKRIKAVLEDPAMPIEFGKNKKGMQSEELLDEKDIADCKGLWLQARDAAVHHARMLNNYGLHKQHANRLLEPFSWITTIISATEFSNFFALRNHEAAQPEFRRLAAEMERQYNESEPHLYLSGAWHMPFLRDADFDDDSAVGLEQLKKISVARCARVSYENHDGVRCISDDLDLFERLHTARPLHASAFEHVAQAMSREAYADGQVYSGNFKGWFQYRKMFRRESYDALDLKNLRASQAKVK